MKLKDGPSGRYYIKMRLISPRKAESVARLSLRSQVRNNNITSYLHNAENTFQRGWQRSEAVYEKGRGREWERVDPSSFKYHTGHLIICRYIKISFHRRFTVENPQIGNSGRYIRIPVSLVQIRAFE
ncbi:hypothetical protein V1478_011413 [Vespula squamosa]|uniref:Uncharacterized protein n=1 Tax=Vespula squamosa TaxID=30214 RepID=A0ABD2AEF0_VESSQ